MNKVLDRKRMRREYLRSKAEGYKTNVIGTARLTGSVFIVVIGVILMFTPYGFFFGSIITVLGVIGQAMVIRR